LTRNQLIKEVFKLETSVIMYSIILPKKNHVKRMEICVSVAHHYDQSYLGGRDQKDLGSRSALANSS
jgi:hypothetical protein